MVANFTFTIVVVVVDDDDDFIVVSSNIIQLFKLFTRRFAWWAFFFFQCPSPGSSSKRSYSNHISQVLLDAQKYQMMNNAVQPISMMPAFYAGGQRFANLIKLSINSSLRLSIYRSIYLFLLIPLRLSSSIDLSPTHPHPLSLPFSRSLFLFFFIYKYTQLWVKFLLFLYKGGFGIK